MTYFTKEFYTAMKTNETTNESLWMTHKNYNGWQRTGIKDYILHENEGESVSHSVVSDSSQLHGL